MDHKIVKSTKFTLCILPTQYGKTFTVISKIDSEIKKDHNDRSLHIIFTMNTLLNNDQFAKRLETIELQYGKGSVCVFSSKYNGQYRFAKNILNLQGLVLNIDTCPRVIVMCSNTTRFTDGVNFIKVLDGNKTLISRAFAYYDELHKYINPKLRTQIETIHKYNIIKGIIGLSATPDKIFVETEPGIEQTFWSQIELITLDNFYDRDYIGYKDIKFKCVDNDIYSKYKCDKMELNNNAKKVLSYIEYILEKYPNIIQKNTITFIPAHTQVITHKYVRKLVLKKNKNAVVILMNGQEKTIKYNNIKYILNNSNNEVCDEIATYIIEHKLISRPIVFTGFLCVGMGQTLTHRLLGSFTSAIFGHLDLKNDEIYQLFGRITGRMKDWDTYKQTEVYCPSNIKSICITMEECARNMANEHNGDIISQTDYREPMHTLGHIGMPALNNIRPTKKIKNTDHKNDKEYKIFDTQNEAIEYSKIHLKKKFDKRNDTRAPEALIQDDNKNPSVEDIISRMWGLNEKNPARMIPTNDDKWCVYWRPSLINKD